MVVRARPEPELFQLSGVLMLFGLALLLGLLILEAAVVQELTDRRLRVRCDLYAVGVAGPGHLYRLSCRDDARRRPIFVGESGCWSSYRAIDARAGRWPLWHVTGLDAGGPP